MNKNNSLVGKCYHKLFLIIVVISCLFTSCKIIETYWQYDLGLNEATIHGKVYYSTDAVHWHVLTPGKDTLVYSNVKFYFKAVSDSGYALMDWNHPKVVCGNNPYITQGVNITENTTLFPIFEEVTNRYTVRASDEMAIANGNIRYSLDSNTWYDLDQNGTPPIIHNQKIWLVAIPTAGYFLYQWTNDASGTKDSISLIVNKNLIVGATFNIRKYVLTLPSIAEGTLTYSTDSATWKSATSPADTVQILADTKIYVRVQPVQGKQLKNIQVNAMNVSPDSINLVQGTVTIIMNNDKTINPIFNNTYSLTLKSNNGETIKAYWKNSYATVDEISSANLNTILEGTKVYIKVTPPTGKTIEDIKTNGVTSDDVNINLGTATVTMNSNKTITATLKITYKLTLNSILATSNGKPIPNILAFSDPNYNVPILDIDHIAPGTIVYLKTTPGRDPVLQTMKTFGSNTDNFSPYQGTGTVTMNSDKTVTATFEALSQFPFSGNTITRYNGSLSEIVFPAVNISGDSVLSVSGNGNGGPSGSMFANPRNITSIILPNSLRRIENNAFEGTRNLSNINIPNTVNYIGELIFYGSSLKNITLPKELTYIGKYAFVTCEFSSITIPANVTYIGLGNFYLMPTLRNIYILNPTPARLGDFLSGTNPTFGNTQKIHIPAGTINIYKNAPGWNEHYNNGQIIDY